MAKIEGETYAEYKIMNIQRLRNSYNGNPRYALTLDGPPGDDRSIRVQNTASDVSVGYEIGNTGLRQGDTVEVAFDRKGQIIDIEPVKG